MAPTIFAIDTAGERCHLALAHAAGTELFSGEAGQTHLEHVLPMIERLFARCGLRPQQCDAFAFGSGPGSFTGLRVACTIVQGLALGAGRPVIAVGNLLALVCEAASVPGAAPAPPGSRLGFAAVDARMQQAYFAVYEGRGTAWTERAVPALCEQVEIPMMIARWKPDFCCGNAPALGAAPACGGAALVAAAGGTDAMVRLAAAKFAAGETLAPQFAVPAYVRDKVAQTVAQRRSGGSP